MLRNAIGVSPLERIGFEHCGLESQMCVYRERLERMGLEGGSLEMINDIWGRFEWTRILLKKHEILKSIRPRRARADWLLAL